MPTLFSYTFQPNQAFVATDIALTLTIQNPITGNSVQFAGGPRGDEIDIYFPVGSSATDLVSALTFNATSQTQKFTCAKAASGDYFIVRAPAGATLTPGSQIVILFQPVTVNGVTGEAAVKIKEYIGSAKNDDSKVITKLPQELNIIAWLDPWTIGLNQKATLLWQSMGGTTVEIHGFTDGPPVRIFKVSGDPPHPGNTDVGVGATEIQHTYIVRVLTDDGNHRETSVTLTQHQPMITSFTADRSGTISVIDTVNLCWSLLYAASSSLKTPPQLLTNPLSPKAVVPGQDIVQAYKGNYGAMPDTASYVLTAYGFQGNPSLTLSFQLAPVQLSFFKFSVNKGGVLSGIVYRTNPQNWAPVQMNVVSPTLNTLTIFQPGQDSNIYYLGSGDTVNPQVQYFNAADDGNGQFLFSWVTANLKALVLNPGGIQIASGDIQTGSQTLSLTAAQYTLTGTGNNGNTIVSVLDVPYTPPSAVRFRTWHSGWEIGIRQLESILNFYSPSPANIQDVALALQQLNFGDIWQLPPWRKVQGTIRIEVKGAVSGGGRHWQIHVNGIKTHALISEVIVDGTLAVAEEDGIKAEILNYFRQQALYGSMEAKCKIQLFGFPSR